MRSRWLNITALVICLSLPVAAQESASKAERLSAPLVPQTEAQIAATDTALPGSLDFIQRGGWLRFWQRYQPANIGSPDLANSAALAAGAEGTLYLSLHQVLEMALASDLDIADAAYNQLLAQPDYLRTLAGGSARGVAGESISSALFSGALGSSVVGGGGGGGTSAGSVGGGGSGVHGGGGGYDPTFNFSYADEHSRTPLLNPVLYGTSVQILNQSSGFASFGQNFTTGTGFSVSGGSSRQYQNSNDLFFNPVVSSDISVGVSQQLLNGAGRAVNQAPIQIGRNGLRFADAAFKAKVIDVVAQAATQYWTLAAAVRQVEIANEAEQHAQETLNDTEELIQQGKVPDANRITAQAGVSAAEQARLSAQTDFSKAASKLKLFLARQWSGSVIGLRVMPSDQLPPEPDIDLPPVDRMVSRAIASSPQLTQDRVNLDNDVLTVKVRKNFLLPSLAVVASYTSSGVSGLAANCTVSQFPCPAADVLPPLPGGFSNSVHKIFSYSAPDYGLGFSLSVPVFNRVNRADEATAELQVAQQQVDLQKDTNSISEQVNEDRIDLEGQSAQLRVALRAQDEQRQSLDSTRQKYLLGKATIDDVVVAEVALVNAQKSVVSVQSAYSASKVTLAKDSGTLLDDYHVVLPAASAPPTKTLH